MCLLNSLQLSRPGTPPARWRGCQRSHPSWRGRTSCVALPLPRALIHKAPLPLWRPGSAARSHPGGRFPLYCSTPRFLKGRRPMCARPPLQKRRLRPRIEDFRPGRSAACLRHSAVDNEGRAWGGGRRGRVGRLTSRSRCFTRSPPRGSSGISCARSPCTRDTSGSPPPALPPRGTRAPPRRPRTARSSRGGARRRRTARRPGPGAAGGPARRGPRSFEKSNF